MKRLTYVVVLLALFGSVAGTARADGGQVLPGRTVAESAEAFVRSELRVSEAHSVRTLPELRVAAGQLALTARWAGAKPAGDMSGRRVIVPVGVLVDGRLRQTIAVLVEVGGTASTTSSTARPAAAGAPPAASAPAAVAVKRGERLNITCRAAAGGIQIELDGRAMDNGAVGDRVRVQLDTPRRIVEVRVTGPQQAEMNL